MNSDQENPDQEKALIMQTVEELPTANRDSLAFVMVHLIRVVQSVGNQMESRALAKIFGPTIVGHSMVDPPMTEILAENPKQIKVMEALFRIPEDYWNGLLLTTNSWEPNQCTTLYTIFTPFLTSIELNFIPNNRFSEQTNDE